MSKFYQKLEEIRRRGDIYVIAEVGSNYQTHDDLVGAVSLAKACGADAVKYQYLHQSELYGPDPVCDIGFPLERLKAKCDHFGIDFLCTAFSPEGVSHVDKFVDAHKVASSEMQHLRLLEAVNKTVKPVLLSTGAQGLNDVLIVLEWFRDRDPERMVIPLHCNVSYPTRFVDIARLNAISEMAYIYGYSDHTTSIDVVPSVIKNHGCTVLEKHFNPHEYTNTPDAPHSLNVIEFKAMVEVLRGRKPAITEENEARLMHVRRIVATKEIKPGDVLKEGVNIGIFRVKQPDAHGVSPFFIKSFEGQTALTAKQPGDGISYGDASKRRAWA